MKFYRLSESHPKYGLTGNVIPHNVYSALPYTDKALYDLIDEHGRGFAYKIELSINSKPPSLFYFHYYGDVVVFNHRIAERSGVRAEASPIIIPRKDAAIVAGDFTITIKYREEWEQDSDTLLTKDTRSK